MVTCPSFAATFVRLSSVPGVFHAAFWPPSSHRAVVRCAILGWRTAPYPYAIAWASRVRLCRAVLAADGSRPVEVEGALSGFVEHQFEDNVRV